MKDAAAGLCYRCMLVCGGWSVGESTTGGCGGKMRNEERLPFLLLLLKKKKNNTWKYYIDINQKTLT